MAELKVFYCTFGLGHPFTNHVQPILAKDEEQAFEVMFQTFGRDWAYCYTEENWHNSFMKKEVNPINLDLLDARKVLLSDYVR